MAVRNPHPISRTCSARQVLLWFARSVNLSGQSYERGKSWTLISEHTYNIPAHHSRSPTMQDDFASLFAFNRWANAKMLDSCRKLSVEQYAAEPVPGWSSVRSTVHHIAIVTEGWLRGLAADPDESVPT